MLFCNIVIITPGTSLFGKKKQDCDVSILRLILSDSTINSKTDFFQFMYYFSNALYWILWCCIVLHHTALYRIVFFIFIMSVNTLCVYFYHFL